jgi:tRNA threonylcarbamoyladenosine biosynthesis protein TsaB
MTLRVLALDAALARCSAAVVADGVVLAQRSQDTARGHASLLPVMVRDVLDETPGVPDFVAVTIGPGSFTGIRAGLALAHGIALSLDVPVVAVTVGEALAAALPDLHGRPLWSAIDSRRDRVFLEIGGVVSAYDLHALPVPTGPIAIAGDASIQVTARLAARDFDVMLTNARLPSAWAIAAAGAERFAGRMPPRDAQPLYVDPPEAKLPAGGLRPPPTA